MAATVSDVLEARRSAGEPSPILGTGLSIAFHAAFLVILVLVSRPRKVQFIPSYTQVNIVSPAAIGKPKGAPRVATAPKPVEAPPAPPVKAGIEKLRDEPKPSEKAMPLPEKKKPEPAKPAASAAPPAKTAPEIDLPPVGNEAGEATGTSVFGTSIAKFDADFPFAYYIEQLQTLIGQKWVKPDVAVGTFTVLSFRIQRSGQVTDVKIDLPSSMSFYDRSCSRAVQLANPLPPLPPEFRPDSLGVQIRFE
ncbi:MAG: TonB family protein [Acidobacteria bacterium]|nr:TonB family protein [Acidobacteriota bacterium]